MSRLKEGGGRIKEERVVYDDDDRCLKLSVSSTRNCDVDGDESSKVVEMSSYSRGLKQFMMVNQLPRQTSVLERQILPGFISSSSAGEKLGGGDQCSNTISSQPQLTIFYAGMVNVFDNIPPEKAEAMVLLAQQSCSSKSKETEPPKLKKPLPCPGPGSGLRLPVARKISLQHFMEKRRLRITSKSPYNPKLKQIIVEEEEEEDKKSKNVNGGSDDDDDDHVVSLSPFPSRSRHFLSLTPPAPATTEANCQDMT